MQIQDIEFRELVREMRRKQKQYFATRDKNILARSKSLEKKVDELLDRDINPRLFDQ